MNDSACRSSISSSDWSEELCDLEKEQTEYIKRILEQVDNALYGDEFIEGQACEENDQQNIASQFLSQQKEDLDDWSTRFPHFRVVGKRIRSFPTKESFSVCNQSPSTVKPTKVSPVIHPIEEHFEDETQSNSFMRDVVSPQAVTNQSPANHGRRTSCEVITRHTNVVQCNHAPLTSCLPECGKNVIKQHLLYHLFKDFSVWLLNEVNQRIDSASRVEPQSFHAENNLSKSPNILTNCQPRNEAQRNDSISPKYQPLRPEKPTIPLANSSNPVTQICSPNDSFPNSLNGFLTVSTKQLLHRKNGVKNEQTDGEYVKPAVCDNELLRETSTSVIQSKQAVKPQSIMSCDEQTLNRSLNRMHLDKRGLLKDNTICLHQNRSVSFHTQSPFLSNAVYRQISSKLPPISAKLEKPLNECAKREERPLLSAPNRYARDKLRVNMTNNSQNTFQTSNSVSQQYRIRNDPLGAPFQDHLFDSTFSKRDSNNNANDPSFISGLHSRTTRSALTNRATFSGRKQNGNDRCRSTITSSVCTDSNERPISRAIFLGSKKRNFERRA